MMRKSSRMTASPVVHSLLFTFDSSEEDNDPLTDDGGSALFVHVSNRSNRPLHGAKSSTRTGRHQLASSMLSDDGTDSQTYDGDVESTVTAGAGQNTTSKGFLNLHHSSSTSTLTSQVDDRIPSPSASQRSAPLQVQPLPPMEESIPANATAHSFNPATLSAEEVQSFVRRAVEGEPGRPYRINPPPTDRQIRIFADGVYDLFHFGHALQLRQAKLSFPNVYLLVGVNSDEDVVSHKARCEAVRHCRWVDEVIPNSPWILNAAFLEKWKIDYVAHDEVPYVAEGHDDVYAFVKQQGKFIPTRRTPGVSTSDLLERIVSGYRNRDFDKKLEMMGHGELKAEGSDFDGVRSQSQSPGESAVRI
ncbi:hypothetical protein ID866_4035 [Astraeus odoratus]|nr:hypothetical protein ID866_4035 [Astraeus odoratus]